MRPGLGLLALVGLLGCGADPEPAPAPRPQPTASAAPAPDPLQAALEARGTVVRRPGETQEAYRTRVEARHEERAAELEARRERLEESKELLAGLAREWVGALAAGEALVHPASPVGDELAPLRLDLGAPEDEAGLRFAQAAFVAYCLDPDVRGRARELGLWEVRIDDSRAATFFRRGEDGPFSAMTWRLLERGPVLEALVGAERADLLRLARELETGIARDVAAIEAGVAALQGAERLEDRRPLFSEEAQPLAEAIASKPDAAEALAGAKPGPIRVRGPVGLATLETEHGPLQLHFLREGDAFRVRAISGDAARRLFLGRAE